MAAAAASSSADARHCRDTEVLLWRLCLLRAVFFLFAVAGSFLALPPVLDPEPAARGMIPGMLAGLWTLNFLEIRYPLQMLPIFLFEFVWKTIWLLAFGLPQWFGWTDASPRIGEDMLAIGLGPVFFGLIIPWPYVWAHYVKEPSERWK